jgi:hypothetical protein
MTSATLGRLGARLFFLALDLLFGLPSRPRDTGIRSIVGETRARVRAQAAALRRLAPPGRRSARLWLGRGGGLRPG